MNNVVYGKSMENLRNRVHVRLVNNNNNNKKMDIKTKLHNTTKFERDLVLIPKIKTTVMLSKPAYVGMCILQLRKVPMYEFHYDYIKNKYGNKSIITHIY